MIGGEKIEEGSEKAKLCRKSGGFKLKQATAASAAPAFSFSSFSAAPAPPVVPDRDNREAPLSLVSNFAQGFKTAPVDILKGIIAEMAKSGKISNFAEYGLDQYYNPDPASDMWESKRLTK